MQQRQLDSRFAILHQHPTFNQIQYIFWIQIRNLLTAPTRFRIHDSTPTSYIESKLNIFLDPIQIKKIQQRKCDLQFTILHQHPTLNQIQYIFWSNTNKKLCNSANMIHNLQFHTNILHWIKIEYIFGSNTNIKNL